MESAGLDMSDPRVEDILRIVSKETEIDLSRLRPEATIDELGIPSLDMAQTVFALETHFDVEIPVVAERAGAEFTTVGDLIEHVLGSVDRASAAKATSA